MEPSEKASKHLSRMVYVTNPIRREKQKVSRNDLCPCGSGKKYKKCCLQIEEPTTKK